MKAGFDAIELHGAHGYLLNEFMSPYTNKRRDRFGGDLEGRSRFPLQVVRNVKEAVADRAILSYRISVVEFVKGGLDIDDAIFFAKKLKGAGVQIIHVSAGLNETLSAIKLADEVVSEGKADLIATGRALIVDPYWPVKAQQGRLDEIRRCIACNQGCMENVVMGNSLTCLHNPEVAYENKHGLGKR
jgi:2,4-dienoyl-CoA reductase-like NADH-dependent reductase (Old Yellow Enzyme family)